MKSSTTRDPIRVKPGKRSTHLRLVTYQLRAPSNTRSDQSNTRPCACDGLSSRLHSIGVIDSETMPDINTATPTVTANSRNRRPTIPSMNMIGTNTTTSEIVIVITVEEI